MRPKPCNHDYFNDVSTQEQAYWLGFIAADGSVTEKGLFEINLKATDSDHLTRLRQALSSEHTVGIDCRRARLAIRSSVICQALAKYSIVPRKTRTLRWPILPVALQSHYLRGYFDGDGCVTRQCHQNPRWRPSLTLTFTGNQGFLNSMQGYLVTTCEVKERRLIPQPGEPYTFNLRYGGIRQVFRLAELLYREANVYLPRKLSVFQTYLKEYPGISPESSIMEILLPASF